MKSLKIFKNLTTFFVFSLLLITIPMKAQTIDVTSIVPDSVGIWGPRQDVDMGGTLCSFRIRVSKHKGTTCNYDIEISNKGNKSLTGVMDILTQSGQINVNTAGRVTVKPGESFYWSRQKLGVFKKGRKNQAEICKACNPILGFYNLKVGGVYVD